MERSFFLRVKSEALEEVKAAFPGGQVYVLDGHKEDAGYVTAPLKEKDCADKRNALGAAVYNCIRMGE